MIKTLTLAIAATGLIAATVMPADASAATRRHHYTNKSCRSAATTGTVIGAVGGGLLGRSLGNKGTGSTLLGAGVGGVAGHQIAKKNCKRHKAYR
jgi:uncharacterized protein YcfJ